MATYTQANRQMELITPLGQDKLLMVGFSGTEALSDLFHYEIDCVSEANTDIPFDGLIGQSITIRLNLPDNKKRYFNGICSRFSRGDVGTLFTSYKLEIVPKIWLLTQKAQSRIFQHINIPDILKKVLTGFDVSYNIQGTFHPRDYCVQYRETDFNFLSRLLEEEGIYYYFKHTQSGHQMVLANTPMSHENLPENATLIHTSHAGVAGNMSRIYGWRKTQELTSGKVTLWDHCFELPHKHLETEKPIQESAAMGEVTHKLKLSANGSLEIYDYPGAYAQRFDGIDKGGGEKPADLQKIFEDNARTVGIRMQAVASPTLYAEAKSSYRNVSAGFKFTFQATASDPASTGMKAAGSYVITHVEHKCKLSSNYMAGDWGGTDYENEFKCMPAALPFRPEMKTEKPVVHGTQTAVVVGPSGEEIFTDKYSRVKVQFHWDREGKNNADSSCWLRVGTPWAGKNWGMIHIPRIGQEVIVDFLEGDPDQPIIIGSVYNSDMMPPYKLPDNKTQSGIKSRSSLKGTPTDFNELRFEDLKDSEHIYFHAQKDFFRVVEHNDELKVGFGVKDGIKTHTDGSQKVEIYNEQKIEVGFKDCKLGSQTEKIWNDQTLTVGNGKAQCKDGNQTYKIWNNQDITVGDGKGQCKDGNQIYKIWNNQDITVGDGKGQNKDGSQTETIWKNQTLTIKTGDRTKTIEKGNETIKLNEGNREVTLDKGNEKLTVAKGNIDINASAGKITIEAGQSIELKVGSNSVKIEQQGVTVSGAMCEVNGSGKTTIKGGVVMIN